MNDDALRQLRLEIGRNRRLIDRRFRDATDGVRLILTLRKQFQQASWSRLWTSFALGLFSAADVRKYRIVRVLRDKLEQWPRQGVWTALWNETVGQGQSPPPLPDEQTAPAGDAEPAEPRPSSRREPPEASAAVASANSANADRARSGPTKTKERP